MGVTSLHHCSRIHSNVLFLILIAINSFIQVRNHIGCRRGCCPVYVVPVNPFGPPAVLSCSQCGTICIRKATARNKYHFPYNLCAVRTRICLSVYIQQVCVKQVARFCSSIANAWMRRWSVNDRIAMPLKILFISILTSFFYVFKMTLPTCASHSSMISPCIYHFPSSPSTLFSTDPVPPVF